MNWKIWTGGIAALLILFSIGVGVSYSHGKDVIEDNNFAIVSATEYWSDETGMIVGRFVNWQGNPITVINCSTDVLYPNNTWFIQSQLMSTNLISGDHYTTFTVPAQEGVYDYSVTCYWTQGAVTRSISSSKTFHVNPALNFLRVLNATQQQILGEFDEIDNNLTAIYGDTTYIRNNMVTATAFDNNMTEVFNRFDNVDSDLDILKDYCSDGNTSSSQLCLLVTEIDNKLDSINSTIQTQNDFLVEINQTTHSTYDYMTGTLASNIANIFTTTQQINDTVNTIQSNVTRAIQIEEDKVSLKIVS